MQGDLDELRRFVEKVKGLVAQRADFVEAQTRIALVDPLLRWLGWDVSDPSQVQVEWKRKGQKEGVDYALFEGDDLLLLVEAKQLTDPLKDRGLWQLIKYVPISESEKARWGILTSGRVIVLVNADQKGTLESKIFWRLDLAQVDAPGGPSLQEAADNLRLLRKEALSSGETDKAWDEEQVQSKARAAVEALLGAPSEELVELVRNQAGASDLPKDVVAVHLAALVGKEPNATATATPAGGGVTHRRKLEVYDRPFYEESHDAKAVDQFLAVADAIEKLASAKRWAVKKKPNMYYVGFKYGSRICFLVHWISRVSWDLGFRVPEGAVEEMGAEHWSVHSYDSKSSWAVIRCAEPETANIEELEALFEAAYRFIAGA